MSIVLTILKVIGCLLLILLIVALVLILAVLFVPVHYRIGGTYEDTCDLRIRARWLLPVLFFRYDMRKDYRGGILYLFGIPLLRIGDEDRREHDAVSEDDILKPERADTEVIRETEPDREAEQNKAAKQGGKEKALPVKPRQKKNRKPHFFTKAKAGISRIGKLKGRIQDGIRRCGRVCKLVFTGENKASASLVLQELRYLLHHYGFRSVSGEVHFSAGDPALTGECLGLISMFPFFYRKNRTLMADFLSDEFYIRGHGKAAGRVRMVHLIRSLLHIWKDKNIRNLIRQVQKQEE